MTKSQSVVIKPGSSGNASVNSIGNIVSSENLGVLNDKVLNENGFQ